MNEKKLCLEDYKLEIVGALILLVISIVLPYLGVTKDVAWFAGIMSVLLTLIVVAIKQYIAKLVVDLITP